MLKKVLFSGIFFMLFCLTRGIAQPSWTLDPFGNEKKPEKYEERQLPSEKTATKKFTTVRRFVNNTTSHYNYFFNANNKINSVIERAKLTNQDDYTKLLRFYPYTLENTAAQEIELDSVIYKAGAGILLHDLRSDWVDNLYLLMGKAYFFRKELDSAALTFQFINYNLFPRKKNEDESRVVGSNLNVTDEARAFSIADKENRNVIKKVTSRPASRNESLLWLIRTFIEQNNYGEAAGLINILQNDPNFPKRLHNDLDLLTGYWFYKQNVMDSSAVYLEKGLRVANNKSDRARWEYLLAQMNERNGNYSNAVLYYTKAAKHTIDPLMDIYANLNKAKMLRGDGAVEDLNKSIAKLLKMSKKDKYQAYRDIIYYAVADIKMDLPDTTAAINYYTKSIEKHNQANVGYKSKSYLALADISFHQRDYKYAAMYYDSILVEDTAVLEDLDYDIEARKITLKNLVRHLENIQLQDSMQMVALMQDPEREEFIRKVVKQLRKEQGQPEVDAVNTGNVPITFSKDNDKPQDLFQTTTKGEWYFYNNNLRTKGFADFTAKWGKRSNVDNWRRSAVAVKKDNHGMMPSGTLDSLRNAEAAAANEITYENLLKNLPLTPEALDSSNAIIGESLLSLAAIFMYELEDYEQAINMYELYLSRFPNKLEDGEVYLGMYYAYYKLGNYQRADYYKGLLNKDFPNSVANKKITDPESLDPNRKDPVVEKQYENIYQMFIEGDFENAIAQKLKADSLHGDHYLTPQLLYIEAVYYIQQRNDSTAIKVLNRISVLYPNTEMQKKAINLIDVLNRRSEIEGYLNALEVTRAPEDERIFIEDDVKGEQPKVVEVKKVDPVPQQPTKVTPTEPPVAPAEPTFTDGVFTLSPKTSHYVLMVMNKVDGVFQNEAKNAFNRYNRELFFSMKLNIETVPLDAENVLLVTSSFENANAAMSYFDKIKRAAPREVSWLPATKYYFLIIDESSYQLLRDNKNLNGFRSLLNQAYDNKF